MEQSVFSIKATQKALKILTSNLYSNPVRAICQELGQNSLDSHILAGKALTAFQIHLPTVMEPYFSTKDKGVGMSHDFMMKGYTRVFESTKDKDNSLTGGFGIGKLSFLSLSDAYTVICHDGEVRREYSVYFNDRGIPTIALMVEAEDDEEKGVEVKGPIPRHLHGQFQQEAQNHVYRFYKVKPIVKGGSGWPGFEEIEYSLKSNDGDWGFPKIRSIDLEGDSVSTVVMGVYHFRLEAASITKVTDEQRALIDSGIILHVPLGELDTASNRESLYYNDKTNTTLKRLLNKAQKEIATTVQLAFDKASNMMEAKKLYHDYFKGGGDAHKIGRILGEKPVVFFKGVQIKDAVLEITDGTTAHSYQQRWSRRNHVVGKDELKDEDILVTGQLRLFVADNRATARVKYDVKSKNIHSDYVVVLTFKDAAAKDLFCKTNGLESDYQFTLTSSLPRQPRGDSIRDKRVSIYSFNEKDAVNGYIRRYNCDKYWVAEMVEDDEDLPAKFDDIDDESPVYIIIDRFQPAGFGRDVGRLALLIKELRKLDPKFPSIYGIRLSDVAKAKDWTPFKDVVAPLLETYFKTNDALENISTSDFGNYINKQLTYLIPDLDKVVKRAATIAEHNKVYSMMESAAHLYGRAIKLPIRKKDDLAKDIKAAIAALETTYPLLNKMLNTYHFDKKDIEGYIAVVDKALAS